MRAVVLGLAVGGCAAGLHPPRRRRSNQIKPRVLSMVDTSGSMTEHFTDNTGDRRRRLDVLPATTS